ncbi:ABC transporter permease [Collinsella intestinalis]|uniref:ABC transporter permease n=1 Tax=Collinsella intestinalis TaxID=147207 RepID=UPI00195BBFD2|nr:ABC transporter permease [Collinsella intestinalis]MBM6943201.1 ABC transporter permease [Collinsella intestinalis]
MPVLKTAIRLVAEHRVLFAVYVLLFSVVGSFAAGSVGPASASYEAARPVVAVIDRDDSALSRALTDHLARASDMVDVADSTRALQEAAAKNYADYVLVIPEGYGEALVAAARADADAPDLECVVSYLSANGSLMNERVHGYVQELYAMAAASPSASADELIARVDAAQETGVAVETVDTASPGLPVTYLVYCQFALYALFGGIAAIVGVGLADLRSPEVRQRIGAAPVASTAFDAQIAGAIAVCGIAVWAINAAVGVALYAGELARVPVALTALMLVILFALMLVGMAFGFLIWQIGVRRELVHAIANISAMIISFLAGTWVPLANMSEEVLAVARFAPGAWAVSAMEQLVRATGVTGELVASVLGHVGIVVLFALAIAAAGLAVGRARRAIA